MGLNRKLSAGFVLTSLLLICAFQNCSPAFTAANRNGNGNFGSSSVKVPVFMASGHMGRTVFSCDDGKTWVHDRSENDNARCWVSGDPNFVECDHTPYSGTGLSSGDGAFYASFGWGYNGSVQSSSDGVNWTTLKNDGWGGGVAYAKNSLFVLWGNGSRSVDLGKTWSTSATNAFATLDHPFIKTVGDKFIAMGRGAGVAISNDQGATWNLTTDFQAAWGTDFAEGNGMLVSIGQQSGAPNVGYAARSLDGGLTWESNQVFSQDYLSWNNLIFTGQDFVAFSPGWIWRSSDGVSWTKEALVIPGFNMGLFNGPISYNASTGTFVMITSNWANYYDAQRALRSSDGIHWEVLSPGQFKGGHPIRKIVLGSLDSSACR
jgi:hypothetical protein